jgi:hypothetical protein
MTGRALIAIALALLAAGCDRSKEPTPQSLASEASPPPGAVAVPLPTPPASEMAVPTAPTAARRPLDTGALNERKNPNRLLRFYAAALHARDWESAAKAWGPNSGVTAQTLKQSYDRADPPMLELGQGQIEGAAGSLYYEAPVTLHFGTGAASEKGSLVLRRVNDVPGATAEQLRWHIERSTIGQGQ